MPSISLRPATPGDLLLTYEITKEAMRSYVEQTWGCWDEDEQWQKHQTHFTPATHRIVLADELEAGLLAVEDLPEYLWLVKLYLLARVRDRGIGSSLVSRVVQEARALGKPVRLRVLRVNLRAQALYARHGFRIIDETPERLFMECGL